MNVVRDTNLQPFPAITTALLHSPTHTHWERNCWWPKQKLPPSYRRWRGKTKERNIHPSREYLQIWQLGKALHDFPPKCTQSPEAPTTAECTKLNIFATKMFLLVVWWGFSFFSRQSHYWNRSLWTSKETSQRKPTLAACLHFLSQDLHQFLFSPLSLLFFPYIKIFF